MHRKGHWHTMSQRKSCFIVLEKRKPRKHALSTFRCSAVVMHIHDEVVIEADQRMSLPIVCEQMSRVPPWAAGLPLRCDGYETSFYQKD